MMMPRKVLVVGAAFVLATGSVFAQGQTPGTDDTGVQQRMQNQEDRIDQGVKSGALTPQETGKLESEQTRIRQTEERMTSDGTLSGKERQRLKTMQNKAGADIYNQKHDAQTAPVTQKPRATVRQRQMNQEQRIEQGVTSGELTPKEAGRLEGEQARIQQAKERMKSDGQLTPAERERLNTMQDKAGRDIYRQKHDAQKAPVTK